uniref:Imm53 family immunity protein n=1 Tax=Streptomyces toxytricini TaxID=67369 RepID=UPI003570A95D
MKIATLDNPGWTVEIDLEETDLEGREYPRRDVNRSTQDWVWAWTAEKTFHAAAKCRRAGRRARTGPARPGRPATRPGASTPEVPIRRRFGGPRVRRAGSARP